MVAACMIREEKASCEHRTDGSHLLYHASFVVVNQNTFTTSRIIIS